VNWGITRQYLSKNAESVGVQTRSIQGILVVVS
jgi:hypothetical protein